MIRPRGNVVVLRLIIDAAERKEGGIIVPTKNDSFCQAEVIAVGPGQILASGAVSDTGDLKEGQLVYVNHVQFANQGGKLVPQPRGVAYKFDGKDYFLFSQECIVGIIADKFDGSSGDYVDLAQARAQANILVPDKKIQLAH